MSIRNLFADGYENDAGVYEITVQQLHEKLGEVALIDVRRPDEYTGELGHIKGAKLSTLEDDLEDYLDTLDKKKFYVFICRSGKRSTKACLYAEERGIDNVANMAGGMIAWNEAGYPIVHED